MARLFIYLGILLSQLAFAEDLLRTAETSWFDPTDPTRFSLKVEFDRLGVESAAQILSQKFGGRVEKAGEHYIVRGSSLGDLTLSPDKSGNPPASKAFLTTGTIDLKSTQKVQSAVDALAAAGATTKSAAGGSELKIEVRPVISDHVSPDTGKAASPEELSHFLVNVLRNGNRSEHLDPIRKTGLPTTTRALSGGFLAKLADPKYAPSLADLLVDAGYRETLAQLGQTDAWSLSPTAARERLLSLPHDKVQAAIRHASFASVNAALAHFVPSDPLSSRLKGDATEPSVSFALKSGGNVAEAVHKGLGLIAVTRKYGAIDHDRFVNAESGVNQELLENIRARAASATPTNPAVVHYIMADPTKKLADTSLGATKWSDLEPFYHDTANGIIPNGKQGHKPVRLGPNTVAWHSRTYHATNLQAEHNPGLKNGTLSQALTDNKYLDTMFWETFAPGAMPKTSLLRESSTKDADSMIASLNARYPQGWVLKGTLESSTGLALVTSKTDVKAEIAKYKASDFDEYYKQMKEKWGRADEDIFYNRLKEHPAYLGWKITKYMQDPSHAIVQEMLPLTGEYRVQVIGGRVLGDGASVDRHRYDEFLESGSALARESSPEKIRQVEAYAQWLINQLPPKLRGTPFGFDIAEVGEGKYRLVESNPGPEDGFLYEYEPAIEAFHRFLKRYPQMAQRHEVFTEELSEAEQVKFIQDLCARHGVDPQEQLVRHEVTPTNIKLKVDRETFDPNLFTLVPARCPIARLANTGT